MSENSKIRLQVDPDRLTIDDLIAVESKETSALFLRNFLARYVINGNDEYVEEELARETVGKLTISEVMQAIQEFSKAVENLKDDVLPPENGDE